MIPGSDNPMVIDIRLINTPTKVTMGTLSALNQLIANLLGVFKMNIPPIADRNDPIKHM